MVSVICCLGLFKAPGQEIDLGGISSLPYATLGLGGALSANLRVTTTDILEIFGILSFIFCIIRIVLGR